MKLLNKGIQMIVVFVLCVCFIIQGSAHSLTNWSLQYPASDADSTYSFGIYDCWHINGNNVKYAFQNSTVSSYFSTEIADSFTYAWENLITGTLVTSSDSAHIIVKYDPTYMPDGYVALTEYYYGGNNYHYSVGSNDLFMTYYSPSQDYDYYDMRILAAHEFGHLWGIDDLYYYDDSLNSIYSYAYDFYKATRHDRNAMRIGLDNLWFNPGSNQIWRYQSIPGSFTLRGDIDQDGIISSADSRLVSRYAVGLETFSDLQITIADVDGNGIISSLDSRDILRVATHLDPCFSTDYDEDY